MRLWVIRHAKSSWGDPGLRDFDRPLNGRGKRDGPRMAEWLSAQEEPAEWLWTSTAVRARATAEFVQQGFGIPDDHVVPADELYHASAEALLDTIRSTPASVRSAAIVAHNPGLTWLVNRLGPEPVTDNLPTFGVAAFEVAGAWSDVAFGRATLEILTGPKTID